MSKLGVIVQRGDHGNVLHSRMRWQAIPLGGLVLAGVLSAGHAGAAAPTAMPGPKAPAPVGTEPAVPPEPSCTYLGIDDFGDMQVEVTFVNPLGDVPSLEVTYALLDSGGVRFYTGSEYADLVAADEQFRLHSDTVEELPTSVDPTGITCHVLAIEESYSFGSPSPPSATDSCRFLEVDDFGDIQIELSLTSPFPDTQDVQIYYALRDHAGVRFDDSSTFVELVGAGEAIRLNEDTVTDPPDWVAPETITCSILGIEATDF